MFDGVTEVLGKDIPLRSGFGCALMGGDAEAVAVGKRSGAVRSVGSRPMVSACREQYRSAINANVVHALQHSQTVPL